MSAHFATPTADFLALRSRAINPRRFAAIITATAEAAGLTPKDILGATRRHDVAHPRQVAMALCMDIPGASLPQVGRAFGRDHTTVLHAQRAVGKRMTPDLAAAMDRIRAKAGEARP